MSNSDIPTFIESMMAQGQTLQLEIKSIKEDIFKLLKSQEPLQIMLHAMWYTRMVCFTRTMLKESDEIFEGEYEPQDISYNNALLVPEYLQSCLTSIFSSSQDILKNEPADESSIMKLFSDCEQLIDKSRTYSFVSQVSISDIKADSYQESIKDFQREARGYQELRGKRYTVLEEPFYTLMLANQNELIKSIYKIESSDIVSGITALANSLIRGWNDVLDELEAQMHVFDEIDRDNEEELEAFRARSQTSGLGERLAGPALFDVKQVTKWPDELIKDLSLPCYSNLNNKDSMLSIDPTASMPIKDKPFIEIDGISYCFCYANFLDNFYRTLYSAMRERYIIQHQDNQSAKISFINLWKENQTIASEDAVSLLLERLLPGSILIKNAFHPLNGIAPKKNNLQESDIIIQFDDSILAVEVKGGAYCPSDPIEDPDGHIKAFKTLLEKAAVQAQSTVDYLKRCTDGEGLLYDKDGKTIHTIQTAQIRDYFKLCVTVDDINEFASKAEKLSFLELPEETIALSIDDLLVYEKYFDNPLLFIHFLHQRRKATKNRHIALNDELDHLGLYIDQNWYSESITDRVEGLEDQEKLGNGSLSMIMFDGFRDELNDWFESLYTESHRATKPKQDFPILLEKILTALGTMPSNDSRRLAAFFILDFNDEEREKINETLEVRQNEIVPPNYVLELQAHSSDIIPISIFSEHKPNYNDLTICRDKTMAAIVDRNERARILLNITFGKGGSVLSCQTEMIKADDITENDRVRLEPHIENLRRMRKRSIESRTSKKIGRNEPCPCGSGNKYKKCCGR